MTRRDFIQVGVAGMVAAAYARPRAAALDIPLGFMLHALRADAAKDLPGTLRRVAALGAYSEVELVSFRGYSAATARDGFGPLAPMPTADIRKVVADAGFRTRSCHFKYTELAPDVIGDALEWAIGVGTEYVTVGDVTPSATFEDWKPHFDRLNEIGRRVRAAGLKLGLHTQNDLWRVSATGAMPGHEFMRAVDADNCRLQLDMSSVQTMKVDAAALLRQYPGRFFSMHLRDAKTPTGQGYLPSVPLGQGDVDWQSVMRAAIETKVPHHIVEMQTQGQMDPVEALRLSAQYLRGLSLG